MVKIVRYDFRRSVQVNAEYHADFVRVYNEDREVADSAYHKVMADAFRSLFT